jgi:hypothetical protein
MAKSGPARKEGAQRRRGGEWSDEAPVVRMGEASERTVPAAPRGLLKAQREWWDAFWQHRISAVADPPAQPLVRRLVRYYDLLDRYLEKVRGEPFVEGSQGQPRINPLHAEIRALEQSIRGLEKDLAITPYERTRLGVAQIDEQKSLADLNAALTGDDSDRDGESDPRVVDAD